MPLEKYRRTVSVDRDTEYHYVTLGPKTDVPEWHTLSTESRHPFPTLRAATAFAKVHKREDPQRFVTIDYPDGRRWDGRQWLAA